MRWIYNIHPQVYTILGFPQKPALYFCLMEFAVVDIETTGSHPQGNRITEIAVAIYNGTRLTDFWETLVNPGQPIPRNITALTGIDDHTVRMAPAFEEIAQTVFNLLSGRIFVAHNVNFDYTFLKNELAGCGLTLSSKKLCTMRAARLIIPGLASYSLTNLCRELSIERSVRHRAASDARAALQILEHLLAKNPEAISAMTRAVTQTLPPNLPPEDFNALPTLPGVYYFFNKAGTIIYIGKANNLKKRVIQHFSGQNTSARRQDFLREIHAISFDVCATELMALLLECSQIQRFWPTHNRALKRFEPRFGLFAYEARSGHQHLAVGRLSRHQKCLRTYHSLYEAISGLRELSEEFAIDQRFCHYGVQEREFAVADYPEVAAHNAKVARARDHISQKQPSLLITDKGRHEGEQSCILIDDGVFYGMGYTPIDAKHDVIQELLTPYKSSPYMVRLALSFAAANPNQVRVLNNR